MALAGTESRGLIANAAAWKLSVTRKVRIGGLNFWAFEVGWAANWHAGKKSSSNDERTRSFRETLLNRRTWIEIYHQPTRAVRAAEEGTLAIIRTLSFAETRFEPVEYLV